MTTAESLKHESRELFGLMSAEFSGLFNPTINKSEFTVDVPPSSPCWETLPDINPNKPWTVKTGYIPLLEKNDFISVDIPRTDRNTLVFQRPLSIPSIFLPYIRETKRRQLHLVTQPRECGIEGSDIAASLDQTYALEAEQVTKILSASGIALPLVFTDGVSYAAHIADLRHRSLHWRSVDEIVRPYSPLRELRLRQIIECAGPREEANSCGTLDSSEIRAATKRGVRHHFRGRTIPQQPNASDPGIAITLQAINEAIDPNGNRRQTIISFYGDSYSSRLPEIYGQILEMDGLFAAFDIKDYNPNAQDYKVADFYDPLKGNRSPANQLALVQSMAKVMVDALTM